MALSQPGSAVEWWVFIFDAVWPTNTQPLTLILTLTLGQPTVWGLFWADVLSGSVAQVSTASETQRRPSLPPARLPLPRFVFLPRFVTLVVCQTKRAPFPVFFCFLFFSVRGGASPAAACLLLALTMQSGFPLAQRPEPRWAVSHLTKRDYHDVDACCHTWPSSSSTISTLRRPSSPWFTL